MPTQLILDSAEETTSRQWRYVMTHGDLTTFSDGATELVAALIPGYSDLPDTDEGHSQALAMRHDMCLHLAGLVQVEALVARSAEGWDAQSVSEDVLNALFEDRTTPFAGVSDDAGAVSLEWGCPVPLMLIATDYKPATDRPRPTGNIQWFDPLTELTFLESLDAAGVVLLYARDLGDDEVG